MPLTAAISFGVSPGEPVEHGLAGAVHQLSGSCSDQPGCGRDDLERRGAAGDDPLRVVDQHRLDRGRADIETEIHRSGAPSACVRPLTERCRA